ncbi:Leucine-rich repeat transmembrane protein kinase [Rhynchospora pubera]|uniref:non-specific serine/threonine protein kinase n=1 Tax=Rhynchospora pubera TaxID=906938 RepID=A0AAV8GSD2_9POAL|nr:Leucine-rich repeat transmembrane protein kinase [Rhynchospora pubera]
METPLLNSFSRYRHFYLLLLLGLSSFACLLSSQAQSLTTQEVEALKEIGKKLNKTDWDFSVDPCSKTNGWINATTPLISSNVTCDCTFDNNTTCHVISLQLMRQNLTGVLPDEIANLTYLRYLDLSRNLFSGTIPPVWSSLPVFNLSLQGNRLSGLIPKELGSMPALKSLQLENNLLEGTIPPELGNILTLQRFFITANNITGELPSTFSKLTNLTDIRIDGTGISGKIPDLIQNWGLVNRMDMQGTSMIGPIPSSISMLRNLTELRIVDLPGPKTTFPPLQNAYHLTELVLRNCSIHGEIPSYLGQMMYLVVLDLSFNQLTGHIPANFEQLYTLEYLYLTNNMLTGDIPAWMLRNKASNKVNMDISYNNFTGNPPTDCQQANVNMVSSFSAANKSITPSCLRKNLPCITKAKYKSVFINCGGKSVTIDGNNYEEDMMQIGTSSFQLLYDKWAYSSTGDFVGNEDADYIAHNTSRLLNMQHPELYTEARLSPLSLKYYGLCLENGNYMVKLHFAEILFTDDKTFLSNGKRVFDVFIQGVQVLEDFNIAKKAGGAGRAIVLNFTTQVTDNTLEIHFYWAGKGTTAIPDRGFYGPLISAISMENTHLHKDHIFSTRLIAAVVICFVAIVLISWIFYIKGCCPRLNCKSNGKSGYIFNDINTSEVHARAHYLFSLKELEDATRSFDPSNKIGEGGFGPVYKGVLADGTTVAVKQLSAKSRQGNREFLNEIGIISTLRHPNLVRLFGCCMEGNQLLLIYEFMENNSLGRALFGQVEHQLKLDWNMRYNICIGIARGLAYLHEESTLRIVHRDIKPTNILLDKNLNPKISDFGLAKLTDESGGHISTRIAGTIGYMAPEYATRGSLTYKADVYSFGIVTLEIVSGQNNTNCMPNEDILHLLDWAETLKEQGNLLELVDKRLGKNFSEIEALRMIEIALLCTKTNPNHRPPMSLVVQMLTGEIPVQYSPNGQELSISSGAKNIDSSMQFRVNEDNSQTNYVSSDYSSGSVYCNNQETGFLPLTSISSSLGDISQN